MSEWVLVPVEPTEAMMRELGFSPLAARYKWTCVLDAAPPAPMSYREKQLVEAAKVAIERGVLPGASRWEALKKALAEYE